MGHASAASQTGVPVGSDGFGRDARETLGGKPRVVADDDARARFLGANHVARDGVRDFADVFVREILGDHAAPAVGAELYRDFGRARFVSIRQWLSAFVLQ